MRAAKRDGNHTEVIMAFRRCGLLVIDTARMGDGFPDAVVLDQRHRWQLVEIKNGAKPKSARRLTPAESLMHAAARLRGGIIHIVDSAAEVPELVRGWLE